MKIKASILSLLTISLSSFSLLHGFSVSPESVDFGTLTQNQQVSQSVTIENTSDSVLEITNVRSDCGCTVVQPELTTLLPGYSTTMEVKFNSGMFRGNIVRRVYLQTSQGNKTISVHAYVNPFGNWTVEPETLSIDIPYSSESYNSELKVSHPQNYNVTNVRSTQPWLTVNTQDNTHNLVIDATKLNSGNTNAFLTVNTNDPDMPSFIIPVRINKESNFSITPNPINFGNVSIGSESTQVITIKPWTEDTLPKVFFSGGDAEFISRNENELTYRLVFKPNRVGNIRGQLLIMHNSSQTTVPVFSRVN